MNCAYHMLMSISGPSLKPASHRSPGVIANFQSLLPPPTKSARLDVVSVSTLVEASNQQGVSAYILQF